ncbi:MAG: hypothetical protein HOZ81_20315 [Streptomyces sp.]|nr:hypothetical protein [Streptomyces sp.]NUS81886.1 hypothetical protein [Streptomyces sp.]
MSYLDELPIVSAPECQMDQDLWDLLEKGGERMSLLTVPEFRAVKLLLQVIASGDGVGHEQALTLVGRISRRLPEE